jgi:hypothetical protein
MFNRKEHRDLEEEAHGIVGRTGGINAVLQDGWRVKTPCCFDHTCAPVYHAEKTKAVLPPTFSDMFSGQYEKEGRHPSIDCAYARIGGTFDGLTAREFPRTILGR